MTRQHTLRILFAVVLVAMIAGCETVPTSGPDALVGQWTNSLGTVWTINPDGTFHVAATKPKAQIWGTYTVSGDTITVQETRQSGTIPKNCKGPGVYRFSRPDANTLAFVLVNDVCKPRIQNVTQSVASPVGRWMAIATTFRGAHPCRVLVSAFRRNELLLGSLICVDYKRPRKSRRRDAFASTETLRSQIVRPARAPLIGPRDHSKINFFQPLRLRGQVEISSHCAASRARDARKQTRILCGIKQRSRQCFVIALWHKHAAHAILDRFGNAAVLGGKHRQARRPLLPASNLECLLDYRRDQSGSGAERCASDNRSHAIAPAKRNP